MIEANTVEAQQATPEGLHPNVAGFPMPELPQDLYIPPDALQVFLEVFTGPLDLLLYLIKKQNLDILNIPIAKITDQYMTYIELMEGLRFELAAEYLLMAAVLAEIKSRLLLPRPPQLDEENEPEDPRTALIRRLQAYEQLQLTAGQFDQLSRMERDIFPVYANLPDLRAKRPLPEVSLPELLSALSDLLQRVKLSARHEVKGETLSLRERMSEVLNRLSQRGYLSFVSLFTFDEGRAGVIITFIAILELARQALLDIVQIQPFSEIHVKLRSADV